MDKEVEVNLDKLLDEFPEESTVISDKGVTELSDEGGRLAKKKKKTKKDASKLKKIKKETKDTLKKISKIAVTPGSYGAKSDSRIPAGDKIPLWKWKEQRISERLAKLAKETRPERTQLITDKPEQLLASFGKRDERVELINKIDEQLEPISETESKVFLDESIPLESQQAQIEESQKQAPSSLIHTDFNPSQFVESTPNPELGFYPQTLGMSHVPTSFSGVHSSSILKSDDEVMDKIINWWQEKRERKAKFQFIKQEILGMRPKQILAQRQPVNLLSSTNRLKLSDIFKSKSKKRMSLFGKTKKKKKLL